MAQNRPRGRKRTTGQGSGRVFRREGTSGGPLGGGGFIGRRKSGSSGGSAGQSDGGFTPIGGSGQSSGGLGGLGGLGGGTRGRGKGGCLTTVLMIIAVIVIFRMLSGGGGNLLGSLLGGGTSSISSTSSDSYTSGGETMFGESGLSYTDLLSQYTNGSSQGWLTEDNTGALNTDVSQKARDKYTTIKGSGQDDVTILVYMCGADLESRSGMATSDLAEMQAAAIGDNVNVLVYTGGASKWQNTIVSNKVNQIYQVKGGGVKRLSDNAGTGLMTDPATLSSFIKWAAKNYPANRTSLIFWDHGGGSVSGYGSDEHDMRGDTMTLDEINKALKDGGTKFDFVGFDACLMATTENALMLANHADYLIASEELEPGIGWYYTNWLTKLSSNTSLSTLEIGQTIADDFTTQCAKRCPGQETTLSVVDLAELSMTLPDQLASFSKSANSMIVNGDYQTVATARGTTREFARSTKIDQIDLVHFAEILGTSEGESLAKTIRDAVKYNRTSNRTANAYGLSIYFPYQRLNRVDAMLSTYNNIDMDDDYSSCIRHFAQMQVSGQATSNSSSDPFSSLFGGTSFGGGSYSGSSSSGSYTSTDAMTELISSLLGGNIGGLSSLGLDRSNTAFLTEDQLDVDTIVNYVSQDRLTEDDVKWKENADGDLCISLTPDQWAQISSVDMALYVDDGHGYIEMGLDNAYDFDDEGNLLPIMDRSWVTINGQPAPYYHTETMDNGDDDYRISGIVPVLVNGESAELVLVFDSENEDGYIAGVRYTEGEAETSGKIAETLNEGDVIDFVASCYTYEGEFEQNYIIGESITVEDPAALTVATLPLTDEAGEDAAVTILYCFRDMYGQEYWTEAIEY